MKTQEQKEIDLLLSNSFKVPIKLFGFKFNLQVRKLSVGVLLELSNIFIKMDLDEKTLESQDLGDQINAQYNTVHKNAVHAVRVISVALTSNKVFRYFIERALLKQLTPKELLSFAQNLLKASDYSNFMISIALMNGNRLTMPEAIEKEG